MRKKHDKSIATALVIGYSSVFVIGVASENGVLRPIHR